MPKKNKYIAEDGRISIPALWNAWTKPKEKKILTDEDVYNLEMLKKEKYKKIYLEEYEKMLEDELRKKIKESIREEFK